MPVKTAAQMRAAAAQIANETGKRLNTATRVGNALLDMVDSMEIASSLTTLTPSDSSTAVATGNTATLQAAVLAAHAAGGGKIVIPAGDYYFQHGLLDVNVVCQIDNLDFICIEGTGVGVTRLLLINNADASFFNLTGGSSYISIRNMELNGNRANQTPSIVHGIRGDAFSGLWLDSLYIHDISHYGIGIEGFVQQYMFFSNIKLENLGGDGFDQKNKADSNLYQCANNITVTNFGLSSGTQAGWDCRGAWQMTNYVCHFSNTDGSGFRIRNGEINTVAGGGFGGHRSHISNFEIYGPGAVSSASGIECVGRDVMFSNGYVRDVLFGVACAYDIPTSQGAQRGVYANVTCEAYGTAGFITSNGATDNTFTDCTANGSAAGLYGFRIRSSGCSINTPRTLANVTADISVDTTGTFCEITQPRSLGTGGPGAAVTGLDVNGADCKVVGGDISGHTTNCSITAGRFAAVGTTFRSATTDNVVVAVGGDDASFTDCNSRSATSEGYQLRAARTTIRGGQCTANGGLGAQLEATASDCLVDSVYMTGNAADFDDQGTNTVVRQRGPVGSSENQAIANSGTSANMDVPLLPSTTYLMAAEAYASASGIRAAVRDHFMVHRSGALAPTLIATGTRQLSVSTGIGMTRGISGNSLRVTFSNTLGATGVFAIKVWELERMKTVP